jgi:hypothetical protein
MRFLSAAALFLGTASWCLLFLLVGTSHSFTTSIQAQRCRLHSAEAQRQYIFTRHFNNNRGLGNNGRASSSSNNNHLAMHMGHSHKHHDHHEKDTTTDHAASTTTNVTNNNNRSMTTPRSRRRRLQVVIAMAASMLVQPLWKQQRGIRSTGSMSMPSSTHWLATAVASIFVYIAQPIAVNTMVRFRQWMHGISRHTPRYAPDSAADRVTLLGYVTLKKEE